MSDINLSAVVSALNNKADISLENSDRANTIENIATAALNASEASLNVANACNTLINTTLPTKVNKSGDTFNGNVVVDGNLMVTGEINATIKGSSDSAVSATKDSNGNVIVDTYLTKADATNTYLNKLLGGILSGNLGVQGSIYGKSPLNATAGIYNATPTKELRISGQPDTNVGPCLVMYPTTISEHLDNIEIAELSPGGFNFYWSNSDNTDRYCLQAYNNGKLYLSSNNSNEQILSGNIIDGDNSETQGQTFLNIGRVSIASIWGPTDINGQFTFTFHQPFLYAPIISALLYNNGLSNCSLSVGNKTKTSATIYASSSTSYTPLSSFGIQVIAIGIWK